MKELDSEISKTSSDVTQTLESKADQQENQISSVGTTLSNEIDKDKEDIQKYSSRGSDKRPSILSSVHLRKRSTPKRKS